MRLSPPYPLTRYARELEWLVVRCVRCGRYVRVPVYPAFDETCGPARPVTCGFCWADSGGGTTYCVPAQWPQEKVDAWIREQHPSVGERR